MLFPTTYNISSILVSSRTSRVSQCLRTGCTGVTPSPSPGHTSSGETGSWSPRPPTFTTWPPITHWPSPGSVTMSAPEASVPTCVSRSPVVMASWPLACVLTTQMSPAPPRVITVPMFRCPEANTTGQTLTDTLRSWGEARRRTIWSSYFCWDPSLGVPWFFSRYVILSIM